MRSLLLSLLLLVAAGCRSVDKDPEEYADDADADGYTTVTDCDDGDPAVHPSADEVCNGVDDDCDGVTDEDDAVDAPTWYADGDGDGYGTEAVTQVACDPGEGWVEQGGDCDDSDAAYHPGAPEDDCTDPSDYNCDGSVGYADEDGDGVPACEDCDDTSAAVRPGQHELCNGVDDDCDGVVDEDDAVDAPLWYADADADGYGDAGSVTQACDAPSGYVGDDTDCDDADATAYPGAEETCDEVDDDCDGAVDEDATDASTWYLDHDGDGYGDATITTTACDAPSGYVSDATDCDDLDADVSPGATEVCDDDGVDEDCDGAVDDDDASVTGTTTWYADDDGDGYGDPDDSTATCEAPSGYLADDSDCDDTDAAISPDELEYCNEVDDDCDGTVDEDDAEDAEEFYADADGDGYGDADSTTWACEVPSGYTADDSDCDDGDSASYPGATELCDGADNDCDGTADAGSAGADETCALESCDAVLDDLGSASDDWYWLDPESDGTATEYWCDMTTDGGGWTLVSEWDRVSDGDSLSDFESEMTELYNNMGTWTTTSTAIYWADGNHSSDVMAYEHEVEVPNGGETLLDLYYYAYSTENSGVWYYADASGTDSDIACRDDATRSLYSSTEQSYLPGYTCGTTGGASWTWNTTFQDDHGAEVDALEIRSFHDDNGSGDYSLLYSLVFWVR